MDDILFNDHNKDEFPPAHTAEHLLNQVMIRLFGCERSYNAHIERKKSKMSFHLYHKPTRQEEKEIEREMFASLIYLRVYVLIVCPRMSVIASDWCASVIMTFVPVLVSMFALRHKSGALRCSAPTGMSTSTLSGFVLRLSEPKVNNKSLSNAAGIYLCLIIQPSYRQDSGRSRSTLSYNRRCP